MLVRMQAAAVSIHPVHLNSNEVLRVVKEWAMVKYLKLNFKQFSGSQTTRGLQIAIEQNESFFLVLAVR